MTAAELDAFAQVMQERKLLAVKFEGVELHMLPAALMPAQALPTPFIPATEPEPSPEISAPWMAFRREEPRAASQPIDPSDPNAPLDDRALFGADLPQS